MLKNKFTFIIIICLISCNDIKRTAFADVKNSYDITILYSIDSLIDRKPTYFGNEFYSKDSIHLFVGYYFDKDFFEVYVNDQIVYRDTITSDPLSSSAEYVKLGPIVKVESVAIRINNGPTIFVDRFPSNIMELTYHDKHEAALSFTERPQLSE